MKILWAATAVFLAMGTSTPAHAELCAPRPEQWYRGKGPLVIQQPKLLLVTHISKGFYDDPETIRAVQSTIGLLKPEYERIYLHVGGFKNYFYPDCDPAYFYHTIVGDISLDLEAVNEIVLLGGYYSICLGDTTYGVQAAIRKLKQKKDIRITYVIDGDFESIQGVQQHHALDTDAENQIASWVGNTFDYAKLGRTLAANSWDAETLQLLLSSTYQESPIPSEYGIYAHLKNHYWKTSQYGEWIEWTIQEPSKPGGPAINLYFEESGDLAR